MQQQNKIKPYSYSALFLTVLLVHIFADVFISIIENRYHVPLWVELVISEATILIPGLIWMLIHDVSFVQELGFKRIKISTVFMTILLTYLLMPLISLVNLISQLFTTNAVAEISPEVLMGNDFAMIFIIGFFGPFCEEFIFRGIICKGMTRFASVFLSALVSGLFFGLMHMNLNQFCYAFALGLILGVLNYASGSIYTSMIMHTVVNLHNVLMLLALEKFYNVLGISMNDSMFENAMAYASNRSILCFAIGIFLILALVFTAIAIPVFNYIAVCENNSGAYAELFKRPQSIEGEKKTHLWWLNPFSIIATIICVVIIFFLEKILMILGL